MFMKKIVAYLFFTLVFLSTGIINAQVSAASADSTKSKDLVSQLEFIVANSNSFESYKVIKVSYINDFKQSVKDSVDGFHKTIYSLKDSCASLSASKSMLSDELLILNQKLSTNDEACKNMEFLGISVLKSTYNSIMWISILILTGLLVLLFIALKKYVILTNAANARVSELELEFEEHRKLALRREQKIARDFMDYKVKNGL